MATRPTIACCVIAKNESNNIDEWFKSIDGCFDEVHFVDTGSTDDTVEKAKKLGLTVHHFDWIKDFAAARNFAFSKATTDYIFWNDLDDSLSDPEAFKQWRDHAMRFADYWYATYDYANDDKGQPVVSFVRERVVKRSLDCKWEYFVHEGLIPQKGVVPAAQYATTWKIKHRRTVHDIEKDHGRNLAIFEAHKDHLDARMKFYYGKELFENKKPMEAFTVLIDAASSPEKDMAIHDRTLCLQFACYAAVECNQLERAIALAHQGLQLAPNRAEFLVVIADCYVKQNNLVMAIPYYAAAKAAPQSNMSGDKYAGAMFNYKPVYTTYPRVNLIKCYFHLGDFERAQKEAIECVELFKDEESKHLLVEIEKALSATTIKDDAVECDDIVITTPPHNAYEWDSQKYKERAMGGSETAAIEIATWLRRKTKRPVKIFNAREKLFIDEDGVEYHPVSQLLEYTTKHKPYRHIAWRHNHKITKAPTYLWCHDLVTAGVEIDQNFDKILCLSDFHRNYVMAMQGVPAEKVIVTRNGLDPSRFKSDVQKVDGKVIFPSSPDRGLDHAMLIMDQVVKEVPHAELHVFYGIENLEKYGLGHLATKLKQMFSERPYVKYHGAVDQKVLAQHFMESEAWLYPADFIESFCITAIEALSSKCYPIVRDLGALPCTLKPAINQGMADCLDLDVKDPRTHGVWAKHLIDALKEKKWQKMDFSPDQFSWESVADDFIKFMEIENAAT